MRCITPTWPKRVSTLLLAFAIAAVAIILDQTARADFVVVPTGATFIESESGGSIRQGDPSQTFNGAALVDGPYSTGEAAPSDPNDWSQVNPYPSSADPFGFMNWSDGSTDPSRCTGVCDPSFANHSTLVYDLPGLAEIDEIVLWNANGQDWQHRGWDDIEIFASTDGGSSFSSPLTVGGNANPLVGDYPIESPPGSVNDAIILTLDSPVMADAIKLRGFTAASHPKITEVLFVSTAPLPGTDLVLQVNPVTGATRMINQTPDPIEIDFYQIESASGSLSVSGWTSLDDGEGADPPGTGWVEAGGSSSTILGEGSLDLTEVFAQDDTLNLGQVFDPNAPGGLQDLLFKVGIVGGNSEFGSVEYVEFTTFLEADFNQDTNVDGTDLAIWEGAYGSTDAGDANSDGRSDGLDFLVWQRQSGQSTALTSAIAAVPEPSALVLVLAALACFGHRHRNITHDRVLCS